MTEPILTVSGLGKAYARYKSAWHQFAHWIGLPIKASTAQWVLRDVNFAILPGEAVGLIGRNGAGKSTLLKMIVDVISPSAGWVQKRGTVATILELGMGFNIEFTGRENARFASSLLGHDAATIDALMPRIEEFCELGPYLDEPLRTYSSGMQMRLAFSIATAARPDLLIVDEALSVGDAYFQHKSFDRLRQLLGEGTSLLLVSHDRNAIQSICSRAILLDEGTLKKDGPASEVLDYYNALISNTQEGGIRTMHTEDGGQSSTVSGTGEVRLKSYEMLDADGHACDTFNAGQPGRMIIVAEACDDVDRLVLGFMIRDRYGHVVFGTNTALTHQTITGISAGETYTFEIDLDFDVGPGSYSVSLTLCDSRTHLENNYEWRDNVMVFSITDPEDMFIGTSKLPFSIAHHKTET